MVAFLQTKGLSVNTRDKGNWKPLHLAAYDNQASAAEKLLKLGAKDSKNKTGQTALDIAVEHMHIAFLNAYINWRNLPD